jgi:hypothetical protein
MPEVARRSANVTANEGKESVMDVEGALPGFDRFISPTEEFEWLGAGYGATAKNGWRVGVAEGPVWFTDLNCLLFSDNGNSKRYKWTEAEGITLDRDATPTTSPAVTLSVRYDESLDKPTCAAKPSELDKTDTRRQPFSS